MRPIVVTYDGYIECVPTINGGYPIIKGTRTPVRSIVVVYRAVYPSDLSALRALYPHLSQEEIAAALAYYQDHPELVDEDIVRQQVALDQLLATS